MYVSSSRGEDLLALGDARAYEGRVVLGDERDVQLLGVVGEVRRGGLTHGRAVGRVHLAEVGDDELGFARAVLEEVRQLGRALDARNRKLGSVVRPEHATGQYDQKN